MLCPSGWEAWASRCYSVLLFSVIIWRYGGPAGELPVCTGGEAREKLPEIDGLELCGKEASGTEASRATVGPDDHP